MGAEVDTVYHGRREGASTGKVEGLSPYKGGTDSPRKGKELNRRCQRVPQAIFCSPPAWQCCFGDQVLTFLQPPWAPVPNFPPSAWVP